MSSIKGQWSGADILLVASSATCEANMTNHSQDITKQQFQQQLTVPSHKQTLLRNSYVEEKYSIFVYFFKSIFKEKHNR